MCGEGAKSPTEALCGGEGELFCPEGSSAPSKVRRRIRFRSYHPTIMADHRLLSGYNLDPYGTACDFIPLPKSLSTIPHETYDVLLMTPLPCGGDARESLPIKPLMSLTPAVPYFSALQAGVGYYTIGGIATATDFPTADANVRIGKVSDHPLSKATRTAEELCQPGYWCSGGLRHPCEPGSFGDAYGMTGSSCSGACSPGYICGSGSLSPEERPCGVRARLVYQRVTNLALSAEEIPRVSLKIPRARDAQWFCVCFLLPR